MKVRVGIALGNVEPGCMRHGGIGFGDDALRLRLSPADLDWLRQKYFEIHARLNDPKLKPTVQTPRRPVKEPRK